MSATAQNIWKATLGTLELELCRETYDTWLSDAHLLTAEDGQYVVGVRNVYAREWLDKRLKRKIVEVLSHHAQRTVEIRFVVEPPAPPPDLAAAGPLFAQAPDNQVIQASPTPPGDESTPFTADAAPAIRLTNQPLGKETLRQLKKSHASLVLLALRDTPDAWLSYNDLADLTGLSKPALYTAIKILADLGLVERRERTSRTTGREYHLFHAAAPVSQPEPDKGKRGLPVFSSSTILPDKRITTTKNQSTPKTQAPKQLSFDDLPPDWQPLARDLAQRGVFVPVIHQIAAKRQSDPPEKVRETIEYAQRTGKGPGWLANTLRADRLLPVAPPRSDRNPALSWITAGALC